MSRAPADPPRDCSAGRREGHRWLAATLDLAMRPLYPARSLVVPTARGDVLEVGVGTGLNFALYDRAKVTRLVGIEPDPYMMRRARRRAAELALAVDLHEAGAERVPFPPEGFDTVVITWSLCTISDPTAALAEVCRVLRPGGQLLFIEHTRSVQPALARLQQAVTPLWRRVAGGCHLDRPAVELVRASGLLLRDVTAVGRERWTLLPIYRGTAVKTAGQR